MRGKNVEFYISIFQYRILDGLVQNQHRDMSKGIHARDNIAQAISDTYYVVAESVAPYDK